MSRPLLATVFAVLLASAPSLRAADVFLDALDLSKAQPASGAAIKTGSTVAGKKLDHAVTLKPNAPLVLDLKGNAKSFSTSVALDDSSNGDALARAYIVGDGKFLAETGIIKKGDSPKALTADLTGVKQLVLRVDDVATRNNSTLVSFGEPKLALTGDEKPAVLPADQAVPELVVYIDQLDVTKATTGWNEPQINRSAEYNPLTLREKTFLHGFGTHAPSTFVIDLKGAAKSFSALVGVDDDASELGTIGFSLIGDGKVLAKTGTLTRDTPAREIKADLTGIQQLVLVVDSGDDESIDMDHAAWADAKITLDPAKAKARPEARPASEAKLPK